MVEQATSIEITLPEWLKRFDDSGFALASESDRMQLVLSAAQRNIDEKTGGPFAAAIFSYPQPQLIALGINIVVPSQLSTMHAEIVALSLAQRRLGSHDLASAAQQLGIEGFELVSSTEPCAMCMGATHWSGVKRLVTGARDEDARAIGFDEGIKPPNWVEEFEAAGIEVIQNVERISATRILKAYLMSGSPIYNAS